MNLGTAYSPFDCTLSDVKASDLEVLKSIEEGWFIEYKSQAIEVKKIAKSLAAFANQHGGWLFFGIKEKTDNNSAACFPGLGKLELEKVKENVRDASRQCLNPSVYYDSNVVEIPATDADQGNSEEPKYVLIVRIPVSTNTPHIHKDGRIYQRVGDSSNPHFVTDPVIFQSLWDRNGRALDDFNRLALSGAETSKAEENSSYLHLTFSADPLEISNKRFKAGFSEFARIMSSGNLPFDNIFATSEGYVARQQNCNPGGMLTLTWTFYLQGHSKITIPINKLRESPLDHFDFIKGKHLDDQLDGYGILDLNYLLKIIFECVIKHRALASQMSEDGPFYVKGLAENIWRTTPFLDSYDYKDYVEQYGLPCNQAEDSAFPKERGFHALYINKFNWNPTHVCLPMSSDEKKSFIQCVADTTIIAREAFAALGIPMSGVFPDQEKLFDFLADFLTRKDLGINSNKI